MDTTKFSLRPFILSPYTEPFTAQGQVRYFKNEIEYTLKLTGPLQNIKIPRVERPPMMRERIWESTCFELFVASQEDKHYLEFNFCPSGDWWCMEFANYRQPKTDFVWDKTPEFHCLREAPQSLVLNARIALPTHYVQKKIALGISAIIDHPSGEKSYWALSHPSNKPDFHDDSHFLLKY